MCYGYTNVANLLDYTSVVFPVTKADQDIDVIDHDYVPLNGPDRDNWEAYNPETYYRAPVGLQVMGQRLKKERKLAVAETIICALDATHK